MASSSEGVENCFSVTWKIESFRHYWQHRSFIASPIFIARTLKKEELQLKLHLKKKADWDYVSVCLLKLEENEEQEEISLNYELSLFSANGLLLKMLDINWKTLQSNDRSKSDCLLPHKKALGNKKNSYPPLETITVYCRIYGIKGTVIESELCFLQTEINMRHASFVGIVKNFSTLQPLTREEIRIKMNVDESPVISTNCFVDESGQIFIDVFPLPKKQSNFSTCEISVIDNAENEIKSGPDGIWFEQLKIDNVCRIKLFLTKNELMDKKSVYLKENDLFLKFKLSFTDDIKHSSSKSPC
ncbi:speckle-type POZ protein B [Nephila pilipes]|uniref:Speckle-type POZ protein B n=1 Tax=Nephila pilipes TaxID=299642 RepID=A0A8X6PRG9_NEPPI|nr:speckle-type POZ protein B [Nephila pilipes]